MSEMTEIVIPDLGLFSHYPKEAVPRRMDDDKFLHVGLSYCRNISLARKEGCIKKSKGVKVFTASATGATDSVRGIGVLNKFDRPNNYEYPNSQIKTLAASADDGRDDGTDYEGDGDYIKIGNDDDVSYDGIFRFLGFTLAKNDPAGTTVIQSAWLKLKAKSGAGDAWIFTVKADDQNNPDPISDHADYAGRSVTTAYSHVYRQGNYFKQDGANLFIDVTSIIQELVDSNAYTNEAIQLFITDNSSETDHWIRYYAYDKGTSDYYATLEVVITDPAPQRPQYFMFVKGATAGEAWKLDENKVPSEVTQAAHTYAGKYQSQIARFRQFGNDLLMTDDGYEYPQQWDWSTSPSALEDVNEIWKARYMEEFKARVWYGWLNEAGTINKSKLIYSAVNDPTSEGGNLSLPGADALTGLIKLTQDELIAFKEASSFRIVDRQTTASDFQPYQISPRDGSLGANVICDGSHIYGINMRGVFQFPVAGYPNGFRYIQKPIQDEIDKILLTSMNLVWFAYDPIHNLILMHCPDEGYSRNTLCPVFNIDRDCWENISDIWAGNVMEDCYDPDGIPIMLFGQEDGHLKYIGGDDNETANFTGRFDTGALFYRDKLNRIISRTLLSIEPVTNYDGVMTLQFYYKVYDRPGDEAGASWNGPYTHVTLRGNEESVPTVPGSEGKFHIIRVDGTLKDEAFEILGYKLKWNLGTPT